MEKTSVDTLGRELLGVARQGPGRSARTVLGGQDQRLRQTVLSMTAGTALQEHENPGEASLLVLHGKVRLTSEGEEWDATDGELLPIPPRRHALEALQDSSVLLTVAMTG